jgi:hypothetical protein
VLAKGKTKKSKAWISASIAATKDGALNMTGTCAKEVTGPMKGTCQDDSEPPTLFGIHNVVFP